MTVSGGSLILFGAICTYSLDTLPAFGDIVILDMEENMNSGKTHKYFSWAAENAMVSDFDFVQSSNRTLTGSRKAEGFALVEERADIHSRLHASLDPMAQPIYKGEKRPDYIFKADDDALIILGEMERKLRASPRKLTFFGCTCASAYRLLAALTSFSSR